MNQMVLPSAFSSESLQGLETKFVIKTGSVPSGGQGESRGDARVTRSSPGGPVLVVIIVSCGLEASAESRVQVSFSELVSNHRAGNKSHRLQRRKTRSAKREQRSLLLSAAFSSEHFSLFSKETFLAPRRSHTPEWELLLHLAHSMHGRIGSISSSSFCCTTRDKKPI